MAEPRKIYPIDTEAPPPPSQAPDKPLAPPPPPRKRRSRLFRCLCWTLLALVVLVVLLGATVGILFLVFDPKIPKYSVDSLSVANFSLGANMTAAATFNLTVTATNPNKRIGINYRGRSSRLSAWYNGSELCTGSFPEFYQGHRNTTVVHLLLAGETQLGSSLLQDLQQQQQQTGTIPLLFRGKVPVRIKLGSLELPRVIFKVRCDIVVNSLSENNDISLRSSKCKFRLKL